VENKVSKFASIIAIATSITMLTPSAYAAQFSGTGSKVEASVALESASVEPLIQANLATILPGLIEQLLRRKGGGTCGQTRKC
jgi:hypothetical protein